MTDVVQYSQSAIVTDPKAPYVTIDVPKRQTTILRFGWQFRGA